MEEDTQQNDDRVTEAHHVKPECLAPTIAEPSSESPQLLPGDGAANEHAANEADDSGTDHTDGNAACPRAVHHLSQGLVKTL